MRIRQMTAALTLTLVGALLLPALPASATAGGADTSFGDGGKVRTDLGSRLDEAWKLLTQPDDKLLAIGFTQQSTTGSDVAVIRYDADGQLDPTFGDGGKAIVDVTGRRDEAFGAALQTDGKIVVAGEGTISGGGLRMIAVRLTTDGDPDPSFGTDGTVIVPQFAPGSLDSGRDVVVQPGGRIVVGGSSTSSSKTSFALAGLEDDGDLDPTFGGGDGIVEADLGASSDDEMDEMALGATGSIVAAGSSNERIGVARFESDGDLDPTFGGGDGMVATDAGPNASGNGVGIQPVTDRIIVTGRGGNFNDVEFLTLGYEPDGDLDPTFGGGDGIVRTALGGGSDLACAVAFQADGSILAGGDSYQGNSGYDFGLVRYTPDGVLDPTFGKGGGATTDFGRGSDFTYGLATTSSGQIVQAGYSSFGGDVDVTLVRYDASAVANNPDAEVMRSTGPGPRGDGIYNLDGHEQRVSARVKGGSTVTFRMPITNDGTDPDAMTLEGTSGSSRFRTRYRLAGANVTGAVTGPGLDTGILAPGASLTLKATVKIANRAKGSSRSFLVMATSDGDPSRGDAVGFTTKAR